jgi:hypothetical protein
MAKIQNYKNFILALPIDTRYRNEIGQVNAELTLSFMRVVKGPLRPVRPFAYVEEWDRVEGGDDADVVSAIYMAELLLVHSFRRFFCVERNNLLRYFHYF